MAYPTFDTSKPYGQAALLISQGYQPPPNSPGMPYDPTQPAFSGIVSSPLMPGEPGYDPYGSSGSSGTSGTSLGSFTQGMTQDQVRALANQYISAGGAQNIDNGQYWVDYWFNRGGSQDPAYFTSRLQQGIAQQPGYNGIWGNIGGGSSSLSSGTLGGSMPSTTADFPEFDQHLFSPNTYSDPTQDGGYSSGLTVVGVAGPDWESKGAGGPDWVQLSNGAWVPPDHPLAQLAQSLTLSNSGTGSTGQPSPVPPGPDQGAATTAANSLLETLMQRMNQDTTNVNPNDPVIQNQVNAYSAQQQAGVRNQLREAAEKAGIYGSTNLSAEARVANENASQNTAAFTATAVQNELQARRDEVKSAIDNLQGYLTDQQKLQLNKQLSDLDRALQYAKLNEQSSEFGANLSEQGREFDSRMQELMDELSQRAYEFDTSQANNLFA